MRFPGLRPCRMLKHAAIFPNRVKRRLEATAVVAGSVVFPPPSLVIQCGEVDP